MAFELSAKALRDHYRVESYETISSTNATALDRAKDGDPGNLWVASLRQESGRGRRGRVWSTDSGNLAATILVVDDFEPQSAAILGFVAGLSLAEALEDVAPTLAINVGIDGGSGQTRSSRFELKWPNDVLSDGAKLSGILLESMFLNDGRFAVAVGIGVNVASHPQDLPYPATSLQELGNHVTAEELFVSLTDCWCRNVAIWNRGNGTSAIRKKWLTRAAGLGSEVAVRLDGKVQRGIFETIDEECRFVIRDPANGNLIRIAAGDVHFGAVASASAG